MADESEIHQHSGWLIPLAVMIVVAALCAGLFLYYMRPFALRPDTAPFRDNRDSSVAIPVTIGGTALSIPRRYIEPGRRAGNTVALAAALPDMRGYSEDEAQLFAANAPDSPLVHLLIRGGSDRLPAGERLRRIYMPYIANASGGQAPFGLVRYAFRQGSGYSRDDLYAGNGGTLLLLCEQPAQDIPSPNCMVIDEPAGPGISLTYRFKRSQLASWRAIDKGINRLIASFRR